MVEHELHKLLDYAIELAEEEGHRDEIAKIRESAVAKDKIELLKPLLRARLGEALSLLYVHTSEGLHDGTSDEECLSSAEAVRDLLEHVVQLTRSGSRLQRGLKNSINQINAIRSKRPQSP